VDNCDAEQFAADLDTYKGIESVSFIHIAFVTFTLVLYKFLHNCYKLKVNALNAFLASVFYF